MDRQSIVKQQEREALIKSMIIKSVISLAFTIFMLQTSHSEKTIIFFIFTGLYGFLFFYSFCSIVQIVRAFTYSVLAGYISFSLLIGAFLTWHSLLPESETLGIGFVISSILSTIWWGVFLFYDIFKLVSKPSFINKIENFANTHEVIDIPKSIMNAIIRLIYFIKKTRNKGESNDIQDTFSE